MFSFVTFAICFGTIRTSFCLNQTKHAKRNMNDEYYGNYDYNVQGVNNETIDLNSLIFPVPKHFNPRYGVEAPEIELPDDSLADSDLRDHDFIDSLMYVYFGANVKGPVNYGSEIIIIGSSLCCVIELLALCSAFLKRKGKGIIQRDAKVMFLHFMACLLLSNLMYIFNIYVMKDSLQCKLVSFMLYYLHIVTACCLFAYTQWIAKQLLYEFSNLKIILSSVHMAAIFLYLVSRLSSPRDTYETQRYCFLSIKRGTIVDYILPICVLIFFTTFFSLKGIRNINRELSDLEGDYPDYQIKFSQHSKADFISKSRIFTLKEYKRLLKVLCVIQCVFESVWFISVLALETLKESNAASICYCITSVLMNLYLFWKLKLFLPTVDENTFHEDVKESQEAVDIEAEPLFADDIPLLINGENANNVADLKMEYVRI